MFPISPVFIINVFHRCYCSLQYHMWPIYMFLIGSVSNIHVSDRSFYSFLWYVYSILMLSNQSIAQCQSVWSVLCTLNVCPICLVSNESRGKAKYFVTFIDDYSRWCEVRFFRKKRDSLQAFKEYKNVVERQTDRMIKKFQTDNGTEYCSSEFKYGCYIL